ncbi:hypothetical protein TWF481_004633 [Arthrobotrys musiformis]|uniref:Sequence orphan n=2 Tax=Arthrobotrys musiformis TaxID=47236 RepID=A0AAV9WK40_9PEZI
MQSDTAYTAVHERKQPSPQNARLFKRIGADIASAVIAAVAVAPAICMIDKSIVENASGKRRLAASIKDSITQMVTKPQAFFMSRTFGLVAMVYAGTYIVANTTDTFLSHKKGNEDITKVTAGTAKFAGTSSTNILLTLVKDRNFARMFGTGASKPIPLPTYALFCARDCLTILFSFNIPPVLSKILPENVGGLSSLSTAQILAPAGCQFLSTPLHLLGLDLYNRGGKLGVKDRFQAVSANYLKSSLARICRIVPAFGIGGVLNSKCRYHMMRNIEGRMMSDRAVLG